MAKPRKRNPQDATRRNVQAANKRFKALKGHVDLLQERVDHLEARVRTVSLMEQRVYALESLNPALPRPSQADFATAQRALGYRSSTAPRQSIILKK